MSSVKVTNLLHASSANNNLVLGSGGTAQFYNTISVGNATPSTSGCGITFPSTDLHYSTNANTLDDYEEGTWTPTCSNGSTFTGNYIKIGKVVHLFYETSSCGTLVAGSTTLTGIPFTSSGLLGASGSGTFINATSTTAFGGTQLTSTTLYFATASSSAALRGYHCYYVS